MTTQRERLRARQLPTRTVSLPRDPQAYAGAMQELDAAIADSVRRGPTGRERVLAARAAVAACEIEEFVIRCLPPDEWEALIAQHPPTAEQQKKGWHWNLPALRPELLAVSVLPPDGEEPFTADDWREFARDGRMTAGEQDTLVSTAVTLNQRTVQVAAGKG